jgi:pyruvate dehydrogenase E2 component (dihydrolipoamide acetyltransferase)
MATKVVMAQLSPTMEEGKLIEWKIEEGAEVRPGDILAEIETDKANMDVEAMGGGVLRAILVPAGVTAPVGTLIGVIADPDEDIDALLASAADIAAARPAPVPVPVAPAPATPGPPPPSAASPVASAVAAPPDPAPQTTAPRAPVDGDGRLRVSPVARRMAQQAGIELAGIPGSGPAGRIVKRDVEAALQTAPTPAAAAVSAAGPAAGPASAPSVPGATRLVDVAIEHSQMRKTIARRLVESIGPVPHFFLTTEIDMGRALELRAELNAGLESGKIGVNDLLLKAVAEALVRHPEVNASWDDAAIRRHGRVDLGMAVALEDGLITPVVRSVDRKGLEAISVESRDLIERARNRRLTPEEYMGATFTISNLGMFEIDEFTAVINPPEAAILAVGRTEEKAVVVDGQIEIRKRMRVTMSCDHRVIDGAVGARFLETFKAMLENPLVMVL